MKRLLNDDGILCKPQYMRNERSIFCMAAATISSLELASKSMPDPSLPQPSEAMGFALAQPGGPLRRAITARYRVPEELAVRELVGLVRFDPEANERIRGRAKALVERIRAEKGRAFDVDALMHEFELSSGEGITLMCLAEALLRIPDSDTADRLIEETLRNGNWSRHLGASRSPFVNSVCLGLAAMAGLIKVQGALPATIAQLLRGASRPAIRRAMMAAVELLGSQFVLGERIGQAVARAARNEKRGYRYSYDMLGEAATTMEDADLYHEAYVEAIHEIGGTGRGGSVYERPGISVKLSALHPRYGRAQRDRVMRELLPRVKELMLLCKRYDIAISVDAEESDRLELSLDLFEALALDADLAGWQGLGTVVQASQKRCVAVLNWLFDLAERTQRRLMVRLVKGAYWDTEVRRAQIDGMPGYPVYTRKAHTDIAYIACARMLLARPDRVFPQFATHNALTVAQVLELAGQKPDLEFQCLHGMGQTLYDKVVGRKGLGFPCRIYAPVGTHETLLAYLVRRILENGANSSFVNQIIDPNVPLDDLLRNPIALARSNAWTPHPLVPRPQQLYPDRRNSTGVDLTDELALVGLERELRNAAQSCWRASPIIASDSYRVPDATILARSPADRSVVIGKVVEADQMAVEHALRAAELAPGWPLDVNARATILLTAADLFERDLGRLAYLAVREAGKTIPNAIGEIREAVDYCRYYATRLRTERLGRPLGPVVCISPWNFPLAIFVGQIAAALAAGNHVIAKPAEQTPLIAAEAVSLLHSAGVPKSALQFLPGRGETVGASLVADRRVQGVIFTGSLAVAQAIHRSLAARGNLPLIAETGGQNAMIVDSSALPEQVVPDVLSSAFDSAGQRCSALRVLLLQQEVADRYIRMLEGAMRELVVGDPARLDTDVGPIIDREAKDQLDAQVSRLERIGRLIARAPISNLNRGHFVSPVAFEIDSLDRLQGEVFGPVLHVLRYDARELGCVIDRLNETGYGLTLGLHTRLKATVDFVSKRARVGNIYVNRNMIGAVVGVQPFGGEGKSGTGPKAGGPLTLSALVRPPELRHNGLHIVTLGPQRDGAHKPSFAGSGTTIAGEYDGWREVLDRLREHEDSGVAEMARWYSAEIDALADRELPGPTGERNRWMTAPRGTVVALGEGEGGRVGWLGQAFAALAAGNPVIFACRRPDPIAAEVAEWIRCNEGRAIEVRVDPEDRWASMPELAAVLCGDGARAAEASVRVSLREGRRIPVIEPAIHRWAYPLWRLRTERSISENTSASGGNAMLLARVA